MIKRFYTYLCWHGPADAEDAAFPDAVNAVGFTNFSTGDTPAVALTAVELAELLTCGVILLLVTLPTELAVVAFPAEFPDWLTKWFTKGDPGEAGCVSIACGPAPDPAKPLTPLLLLTVAGLPPGVPAALPVPAVFIAIPLPVPPVMAAFSPLVAVPSIVPA